MVRKDIYGLINALGWYLIRNERGEKIIVILPNGIKKDKLLKEVRINKFYVYGVSNLTDGQIAYYERNGEL